MIFCDDPALPTPSHLYELYDSNACENQPITIYAICSQTLNRAEQKQ